MIYADCFRASGGKIVRKENSKKLTVKGLEN
jgi:hypothetical protein